MIYLRLHLVATIEMETLKSNAVLSGEDDMYKPSGVTSSPRGTCGYSME